MQQRESKWESTRKLKNRVVSIDFWKNSNKFPFSFKFKLNNFHQKKDFFSSVWINLFSFVRSTQKCFSWHFNLKCLFRAVASLDKLWKWFIALTEKKNKNPFSIATKEEQNIDKPFKLPFLKISPAGFQTRNLLVFSYFQMMSLRPLGRCATMSRIISFFGRTGA